MCFHGPEEHEEGACWKVTQPQIESLPTIDKFCGCIGNGNTRRFNHRLMGFMVPHELGDLMITKECSGCHQVLNMLINEKLCMVCRDRPENYHPEHPEEVKLALEYLKNLKNQ